MKKYYAIIFGIIGLLSSVAFSNTVHAANVFFDGFETYASGTILNGQGGWISPCTSSPDGSACLISGNPVNSPAQTPQPVPVGNQSYVWSGGGFSSDEHTFTSSTEFYASFVYAPFSPITQDNAVILGNNIGTGSYHRAYYRFGSSSSWCGNSFILLSCILSTYSMFAVNIFLK